MKERSGVVCVLRTQTKQLLAIKAANYKIIKFYFESYLNLKSLHFTSGSFKNTFSFEDGQLEKTPKTKWRNCSSTGGGGDGLQPQGGGAQEDEREILLVDG